MHVCQMPQCPEEACSRSHFPAAPTIQKLDTTISNKRGRSDPAMPHDVVSFLDMQMYAFDRELLFLAPNCYLVDQTSDGYWAKTP